MCHPHPPARLMAARQRPREGPHVRRMVHPRQAVRRMASAPPAHPRRMDLARGISGMWQASGWTTYPRTIPGRQGAGAGAPWSLATVLLNNLAVVAATAAVCWCTGRSRGDAPSGADPRLEGIPMGGPATRKPATNDFFRSIVHGRGTGNRRPVDLLCQIDGHVVRLAKDSDARPPAAKTAGQRYPYDRVLHSGYSTLRKRLDNTPTKVVFLCRRMESKPPPGVVEHSHRYVGMDRDEAYEPVVQVRFPGLLAWLGGLSSSPCRLRDGCCTSSWGAWGSPPSGPPVVGRSGGPPPPWTHSSNQRVTGPRTLTAMLSGLLGGALDSGRLAPCAASHAVPPSSRRSCSWPRMPGTQTPRVGRLPRRVCARLFVEDMPSNIRGGPRRSALKGTEVQAPALTWAPSGPAGAGSAPHARRVEKRAAPLPRRSPPPALAPWFPSAPDGRGCGGESVYVLHTPRGR